MTPLILNDSGLPQISKKGEMTENNNKYKDPVLVDGHVDLPYFLMNLPEDLPLSELADGPFTLKKIKEVGLRLFSSALYCQDKFNGEGSLQHLKHILDFTMHHFDEITIIKGGHDLEGVIEDPDMVGTIFLLENADALVGNLSYIEELMGAGVRIIGLTHAGGNRLGDGHGVSIPGGLTPEGIDVIRVIQDHGLTIDVAHLHPKCFWRLLDIFSGQIISSHTGIRKVCDIQRNIDLEQAGEIIGRDGVVGITFNPQMLSPDGKAGLEHVFIHVDVLVQKFGPDGVGIGSDFCGFDQDVEGLEDIARFPELMDIMSAHGYGEEAVGKIMGLNWLRMYRKLL